MGIVKVKIEERNFEIECKDGEEVVLKEASDLLNQKIKDNLHFKNLPEAKKFLMLSLTLAVESVQDKLNNKISIYHKEIDYELVKLEKLVKDKFDDQ